MNREWLAILILIVMVVGLAFSRGFEIKGSCRPVIIDVPLTKEQIVEKAMFCHKRGMAIQMVYDDLWDVYAVKCIEPTLTGDGRKKE